MSVFKALVDLSFCPDGPGSRKAVKAGELITVSDDLDYIVGSQIHSSQVEKVDLEAAVKASETKVATKADKAAKSE